MISLRSTIRLVLLDLDGTTLRPDHSLSAYTAGVLRRLAGRCHVGFATGRMLDSTADYAAQAGLELPLVVLNGSLVTRAGEPPLWCGALDRAALLDAHRLACDHPAHFWITRHEMAGRRGATRWDYMFVWNNGRHQRTVDDLPAEVGDPVYQMHWVGPEEEIRALAAQMDTPALVLSRWQSSRGPDWHLELRRAGTDKSLGIAQLQERLGVDAAETLVIGDWLNDLGMIRAAGTGVAMGNAHPAVKEAADLVLDGTCADDAAARFLEATLL